MLMRSMTSSRGKPKQSLLVHDGASESFECFQIMIVFWRKALGNMKRYEVLFFLNEYSE